jgi:uncharacterized iron-regulated protein
MRKALFLLLFVCAVSSSTYTQAQNKLSDNNYRVYSVKDGKEVQLKEIVKEMANYDVLFLGEEHNDSVIHFVEKNVLELMQLKFTNEMALSLEMFDRDVQPVMNEYLKNFVREKNFIPDTRAWSNYSDYKPMLVFAKENKVDVICANAASRYRYLAGKRGQIGKDGLADLPEESKNFIAPIPFDTATGEYAKKLVDLLINSSDSFKPKNGGNIYNPIVGQSLSDATIAFSINQYLKKHKDSKVMEVNNRNFSDRGYGIVTQLRKYNNKARILIISSGTDDAFPFVDWAKYKNEGDYIIITDPSIPKTGGEK